MSLFNTQFLWLKNEDVLSLENRLIFQSKTKTGPRAVPESGGTSVPPDKPKEPAAAETPETPAQKQAREQDSELSAETMDHMINDDRNALLERIMKISNSNVSFIRSGNMLPRFSLQRLITTEIDMAGSTAEGLIGLTKRKTQDAIGVTFERGIEHYKRLANRQFQAEKLQGETQKKLERFNSARRAIALARENTSLLRVGTHAKLLWREKTEGVFDVAGRVFKSGDPSERLTQRVHETLGEIGAEAKSERSEIESRFKQKESIHDQTGSEILKIMGIENTEGNRRQVDILVKNKLIRKGRITEPDAEEASKLGLQSGFMRKLIDLPQRLRDDVCQVIESMGSSRFKEKGVADIREARRETSEKMRVYNLQKEREKRLRESGDKLEKWWASAKDEEVDRGNKVTLKFANRAALNGDWEIDHVDKSPSEKVIRLKKDKKELTLTRSKGIWKVEFEKDNITHVFVSIAKHSSPSSQNSAEAA